MQYVVLLVIVADVYFTSQMEDAGVGRDQLVQYFEYRRFSGSVIPDDGHTLPAFDGKVQIRKQREGGKGFREMFHGQHIHAALYAGLQVNTHGRVYLSRFFYDFNLIQHLFPALSPLNGLFPVELL